VLTIRFLKALRVYALFDPGDLSQASSISYANSDWFDESSILVPK